MSTDPYVVRQPIPIRERRTYIPEWGDDVNADLEAPVVDATGAPQGYRRGQVLPERRWAIRSAGEDGKARMLTQQDFAERYLRWISFVVNSQGELVPSHGDPQKEAQPNVDAFCRETRDEIGRAIPIGFDPHSKQFEVPAVLYDSSGENPVPTLEAVKADSDSDRETTPCGTQVKKGYVKQHVRHCKDAACSGGEAA